MALKEFIWPLAELLFQGILTSILVLYIAQKYEKSRILHKAKAATILIHMELSEHIFILSEILQHITTFNKDSSVTLDRSAWDNFCADIIPLISLSDMEMLAAYYRSARMGNILIAPESKQNHFDELRKILDSAVICDNILCSRLD
mgnify:CR=1 FL=1